MGVKITQGGADLEYLASLDDKQVNEAGNRILAKFKELQKAGKGLNFTGISRETEMRKQVTAQIEKQTVAQKKLADEVRKTAFSKSRAEVDAYQRSKNGNT